MRAAHRALLAVLAGSLVLLAPALCRAATGEWRPARNIEVIVGTPAGGPLDGTARLIQKYLEPRHAGSTVLVMNKPGGGHVIAMQYLNQLLTATQIAYWDQTLGAMVKSPEWQQALKANQWENQYLNSAGTVKFLEQEYKELAALLIELGEVKGR